VAAAVPPLPVPRAEKEFGGLIMESLVGKASAHKYPDRPCRLSFMWQVIELQIVKL